MECMTCGRLLLLAKDVIVRTREVETAHDRLGYPVSMKTVGRAVYCEEHAPNGRRRDRAAVIRHGVRAA